MLAPWVTLPSKEGGGEPLLSFYRGVLNTYVLLTFHFLPSGRSN